MKLEETQAWMEAGCPVEEPAVVAVSEPVEQAVDILDPKPEVSVLCRSFHLGVIPSHGVLVARCKDCGVEMEYGEILVMGSGLEGKLVRGVWSALLGLCHQMNGHGQGAWGEVGSMLMGKPGPKPWQAIEAWIGEMMRNGGKYWATSILPSKAPAGFNQSGWRFSFNDSPLWYEPAPGPKRSTSKRPGLLAKLWNRLRPGGGPR